MRFVLIFLFFWLAAATEFIWAANPETKTEKSGGITEISLKREFCLGLCPADEVTFSSDGNAVYAGFGSAPRSGVFTGKIEPFIFNQLAAYLMEQDNFQSGGRVSEPQGTDEVRRSVTVVREGKTITKQLAGILPPKWWAIEELLLAISSKIDWQPVKSGIRGRMLTSVKDKENFWTNLPLPDALIYISRPKNTLTVSRIESIAQSTFLCRTDKEGKFEINLPYGNYTINSRYYPLQGEGVSSPPITVSVETSSFAEVIVTPNNPRK